MVGSKMGRWARVLSIGALALAAGAFVVASASAQTAEQEEAEQVRAKMAQEARERAMLESQALRGMARGRAVREMRAAHELRALAQMKRLSGSLARGMQDRVRVMQDRVRALQDDDTRHRVRLRTSPRIAIALGGHGGGTADRVLAMAEELELSEAQEEQVRDARRAHRRARIERDADIEVAELDLEDLMDDPYTADLGAVEAKMREISELRVQERIAGLRLDRTVHGILTAEQREQLDDGPHNLFFRSGDQGAYFFDGDDLSFGGDFSFPDLEAHEWGDFEFDGENLRMPGRWMERLENLPYGVWRFERDDDEEDDDDEEQDETEQKQEREGIKT